MATCNITGYLKGLDGVILPGQSMRVTRTGVAAQSGDTIVPYTVVVKSDAAGLVDFDILPGNYICEIDFIGYANGRVEKFTIAVPETTSEDLDSLVDAAQIEVTPTDVAAAREARDDAEAARDEVLLYSIEYRDIAAFSSASTTYADFPSGTAGGDTFSVGGDSWITLPSTDTHLYLETAGGVKARLNLPPFVLSQLGQSNGAGSNPDGPNPASTLVATYDAVTGALGGSDRTGLPWTRSNPDGNSGNNNYALAYAHRLAEEGRAVIIVFDAVGGTSIDEWVASGTSSTRYAALKVKVEAALSNAGLSTVDAMIWSQGEEDYPDSFETHLDNLTLLRDQLRDETWCEWHTPIYMTGPSNLHDRYQWQNALQYFCSRVDNRCIYVPSNGLRTEYDEDGTGGGPSSGDYTHFLGESLWELGYYRIPDAAPSESSPPLFYNRGAGPALPSDDTVLATFKSLVSRESWTSENAPNGPAASGSISWGSGCSADGNYSFAFGYDCTTDNVANYGIVTGRDVDADSSSDYFAGFGYQITLSASYVFAAGRGHTIADDFGTAVGGFSQYTTAEVDPVRFQVGIGSSSGSRNNGITVRESGAVELETPSGSTDPTNNGEALFRKVDGDNTKIEIAYRGTDGTVRTVQLDLT